MNTLGKQVHKMMLPRLQKAAEEGGVAMVNAMAEKMKEYTKSPPPPSGIAYNNTYNKDYAKRKGVPVSPVTMRNKKKRIERTVGSAITAKGGKVEFENANEKIDSKNSQSPTVGEVFYWHHTGEAKGGKTRQLFPYSNQHYLVPKDVKEETLKLMTGILNGR